MSGSDWFDEKMSDQYLIDVDPRVFVFWVVCLDTVQAVHINPTQSSVTQCPTETQNIDQNMIFLRCERRASFKYLYAPQTRRCYTLQ